MEMHALSLRYFALRYVYVRDGLILAFFPTGSVHPFSMYADMFSLHFRDFPSF